MPTRQVCPIRYGFRAGVKAILSRVNVALIAFRVCAKAMQYSVTTALVSMGLHVLAL